MKVLHMAHVRWFNAEVQYALDLAEELVRRGHRVSFLAQEHAPGAELARRAGLETWEEGGFNAKGLGLLRSVPAGLRLRRLLRRERPDVVLVHRSEGLPVVAWACRSAGVPAVRVRGDMRPVRADPLNRALHRRWLSGVVATNSAIETSLRERIPGIPRLLTIHGGVDPEAFTPEGAEAEVRRELGFPAGAFLVGILGRLGPVKGHDHFLAAAARAAEAGADARFVILAKEASRREDELRARVRADPRLRDRVGFLGNRRDLPAVLRSFDLGVVSSVGSEANCRVGLEWMASGVPLLATRVGVLPDLVDETCGFLVSPADSSRLAEKIVYLADRRAEARRLGVGARARILGRFTLRSCAEAYESLIRSIPRMP